MLNSLKYFIFHKRVISLEFLINSEGLPIYSFVELKRVKNQVFFVKGEYKILDIQKLKSQIPKNIPVVLNLVGKGILNREIQHFADEEESAKVLFPNADLEDFYLQYDNLETKTYLSIVRKDYVENCLKKLETLGIEIVRIVIGSSNTLKFFDGVDEFIKKDIHLGYHCFSWDERAEKYNHKIFISLDVDNGKIVDIKGQQMSVFLVAPFAVGFEYLAGSLDSFLSISKLDEKAEDFHYKSIFNKTLWISIVLFTIFLIPSLNQLFKYRNFVNTNRWVDPKVIQSQIDSIQYHIENTELKLKGLSRAEHVPWTMAYLTDRILSIKPDSVILHHFEVFPTDLVLSKKNRRPMHKHDQIFITGFSKNLSRVQLWTDLIKKFSFSSNVEIVKFSYDEREETGSFELIVFVLI